MRILIATDSFPPNSGGSGWSTWELARGLRARGHDVLVVQPRPSTAAGRRTREYDGFEVVELGAAAPAVPFVRNYFKNERLTRLLVGALREEIARLGADVVHGQHVLTAPASVEAAAASSVASVVTVRDYWPVCYWSDLILDYRADALCPGCSASRMAVCLKPRAGALWPATLAMIPYMRANLGRKQSALARATAVVAVSSTIAADLAARAEGLDPARLHTIPNPVGLGALDAARGATRPLDGPYALYVGKLAPNKGADLLVPAVRTAGLRMPLVVVGDGPSSDEVRAAASASGLDVRFPGWQAREDALRWIAHAAFLVFPSRGPESLSRVLLEAGALGIPAAAMDTGGTRDIVSHETTGLLSTTVEELARDVARLAADPALRERLGRAAEAHVRATFDAAAVVARIEALYRSAIGARRAEQGRA